MKSQNGWEDGLNFNSNKRVRVRWKLILIRSNRTDYLEIAWVITMLNKYYLRDQAELLETVSGTS